MRISLLLFCGLLIPFLISDGAIAQSFNIVAETPAFTDYELSNEELRIMPAYSVLIPVINGAPGYQIIEQSVATVKDTLSDSRKMDYLLVSQSTPVVETLENGFFRGKEVAPTAIHIARTANDDLLITRKLKLRVYKDNTSPKLKSGVKPKMESSPLAANNWYKIPISEDGIYQIDGKYLSDLGINIANTKPENIQLWGMGGEVLPELNSAPKPEFIEIPIIVESSSSSRFAETDKITFFANSADKEFRKNGEFVNEIHPYSKFNYVFLTVASTTGKRMSAINQGMQPTQTISKVEDFLWKEEELTKAEASLRSGREWLGQTINSTRSGTYVSILTDTIPGISANTPFTVRSQVYGRSLSPLTIDIRLNNTAVGTIVTPAIQSFNKSDGPTARSATINKVITPNISNGIINMELRSTLRSSNDQVFVDWINITFDRELAAKNNRLRFFTPANNVNQDFANYVLKGFNSTPIVMDVTEANNPKLLAVSSSGSNYNLNYYAGNNLKIIAQSQFKTPEMGTAIDNQNLHQFEVYPDYLVITSKELLNQAKELASYRESQGLVPLVVTQEDILNEFSGGLTDPTALRNYIKYIWDLSIANNERMLDYVLFFGDATYDTKGIVANPNLKDHVSTYESIESVSRENTFGTDDYFGYLGDDEGDFSTGQTSNNFLMDVGLGRIPVQNAAEAANFIKKIKIYENSANKGGWQNLMTFAADDDMPNPGEKDLHVYNADVSAAMMNINEPGLRVKKIYEFSYPEEITGAGRSYPEATKDFINAINQGTLCLSYSGHGNEQVLSDEKLFHTNFIPDFINKDRLTILITVTCQFGRYDDTDAQSGAEKIVLADNGGAIASFTTTRVVYTSAFEGNNSNFALSIALSQRMTERNADGTQKRLGEINMQTKNSVISGTNVRIGSSLNNKKFILVGDPATIFQLPAKKARITHINDDDVTNTNNTVQIRALDTINIQGEVLDKDGNTDVGYNGETAVTIFDANRGVSFPERSWITDPETSCRFDNCQYLVENDVLFKGKAMVNNGTFSVPVIIPKDISASDKEGRILIFANSGGTTAGGSFTKINFNGINPDAVNDGTGPDMDIYLNDKSFINGTLVNSSPTLFVELEDESGINTSGTGVGHEIIATIDTQPKQTIILNEYFEGNLNSFTGGRIEYPLDQIPEGNYTLTVRAWDVHNNPSEKEIYFEVAEQEDLAIRNIYNYPNPMNNKTSFTFEHNQPGNPIDVSIQIFTLSGRPVQHLKESIITNSNYASISWNGRDRDNDRLGNGTYVYVLRATATTPKGKQTTEKIEKLVIIR